MSHPRNLEYDLARVLLVDDDPASRLTLQTVLEAGGYNVDAAASAAEAVGKLDERQYELVLSDLQMESPDSGLKVIAHARMMDYKPATALITTYQNAVPGLVRNQNSLLISPEDVPGLLDKVADMISPRATRRLERELRVAGAGVSARHGVFQFFQPSREKVIFRLDQDQPFRLRQARHRRFDLRDRPELVVGALHKHARHGAPVQIRMILIDRRKPGRDDSPRMGLPAAA
jgi:CheY-like chemotaxis protein